MKRIRRRRRNKEKLKKQELKNLIKPEISNFEISKAFKDNNKTPTPIIIKSKSNENNINNISNINLKGGNINPNKKISIPNPLINNNQSNINYNNINKNMPNLGSRRRRRTRRNRRISTRRNRRRSSRRNS